MCTRVYKRRGDFDIANKASASRSIAFLLFHHKNPRNTYGTKEDRTGQTNLY